MDIELRAVSVQRGSTWALRDVSWRLRAGDRWALIGPNGSGKTQLLKLLSGAVWPTPEETTVDGMGRRYRRGSRDLDPVDARRHIAYVGGESQDKYARYDWNLPVRDVLATGLQGSDLLLDSVSAPQRARVSAMLRACRLTRLAERRFLSLSYGEKRLVLLARALVGQPDWLLLDEFYNGLDALYRARIDSVLQRAARRGQAWVVSAHRREDIPRGTSQLLDLDAGRVSYCGRLLGARLTRLAPEKRPAADKPAAPRRRGARLIDIQQANLYIEHHPVIRQLDWQLRRGEHWAVFGANGAGKSSFLKLLYGDLSPALGGSVERTGFPRGTPISEWKRRVSWVTPELQTDYLIDVPLVELVASGRHASIGLNEPLTRADARAALHWLAFFELAERAADRPRELSYGQLRRALMARAMVAEPMLLLLDEPLTGLDPTQRELMKRLLARLMRGRHHSRCAAVHHRDDLPEGITHELHLHKRRGAQLRALNLRPECEQRRACSATLRAVAVLGQGMNMLRAVAAVIGVSVMLCACSGGYAVRAVRAHCGGIMSASR